MAKGADRKQSTKVIELGKKVEEKDKVVKKSSDVSKPVATSTAASSSKVIELGLKKTEEVNTGKEVKKSDALDQRYLTIIQC